MTTEGKSSDSARKKGRQAENEFVAFLSSYGWLAERVTDDVGEDILIRVLNRGDKPSGITFWAQVKGTDELNNYLDSNGQISYPVPVSKVKTWELSSVPVLFVVWDLVTKVGHWMLVSQAALKLDQINSGWRDNNKYVDLKIPLLLSQPAEEIRTLRIVLANYLLKTIHRDRNFQIELAASFPSDAQGSEAFRKYQRMLEEGGDVNISSTYIQQFRASDWVETLFGFDEDEDEGDIHLRAVPTEKTHACRIQVYTRDGRIHIQPYVVFKAVKAGMKQVILSNEHQGTALSIDMVLRSDRPTIKFLPWFAHLGDDVTETRELLSFFRVMENAQRIVVTAHNKPDFLLDFDVPPNLYNFRFSQEYVEFIETLCTIQAKTGQPISVRGAQLTSQILRDIRTVFSAITTGKCSLSNSNVSMEFGQKDLIELAVNAGDGYSINVNKFQKENTIFSFLGATIDLGRSTGFFVGMPISDSASLLTLAETLRSGETVAIQLHIFEGEVSFENWIDSHISTD